MYWIWHIYIFILLIFTLLSSCIWFYTLTFLFYLHLYFFDHVLIFTHRRFYITYTYTYFLTYWFSHLDNFILLTLILISSCIDFYTMTFLHFLHWSFFHHVLVFTHWHVYVSYAYTYFIVYCLWYINVFMLVKLILVSSCI